MSEAVSALNGAAYEGYCRLAEAGLVGMVTIRGALATIAPAVTEATGLEIPARGAITGDGPQLAWMSPDELMLLCDYGEAGRLTAALEAALAGQHALVVDVSDARAVFRLEGSGAREVLAKLTPADLAPGILEPGMMRRTRLAQVPAAFYMTGPERFEIIAFRSVAQYVFDLLKISARPGGEVGLFGQVRKPSGARKPAPALDACEGADHSGGKETT